MAPTWTREADAAPAPAAANSHADGSHEGDESSSASSSSSGRSLMHQESKLSMVPGSENKKIVKRMTMHEHENRMANHLTHFRDDVMMTKKRIEALGSEALTMLTDAPSKKLADQPWFSTLIYLTIIVNSIQMGIEVDYNAEEGTVAHTVFQVMEYGACLIFLLEALIKLGSYGCAFLSDWQNILDVIVVIVSVVDVVSNFAETDIFDGKGSAVQTLRLLRLLRLSRILRLVEGLSELSLMMDAIQDVLVTTISLTAMLGLVFYALSIICTTFVGRDKTIGAFNDNEPLTKWKEQFNPYEYFGTIFRSMFSLLNLFAMVEIDVIGRALFEEAPAALFLIVPFVMFTAYGITSVVIAIVVRSMHRQARDLELYHNKRETGARVKSMHRLLDRINTVAPAETDGMLTLEQLQRGMQDPDVLLYLEELQVPRNFSPHEVLLLVDQTGRGEVTQEEFVIAFERLLDKDDFEQKCLSRVVMNRTKAQMRKIEMIIEEMAVSRFGVNVEHVLRKARERDQQKRSAGDVLATLAPDVAKRHRKEAAMQRVITVGEESGSEESDVEMELKGFGDKVEVLGEEVLEVQKALHAGMNRADQKLKEGLISVKDAVSKHVESNNAVKFSTLSQHLDKRFQELEDRVIEKSDASQTDILASLQRHLENLVDIRQPKQQSNWNFAAVIDSTTGPNQFRAHGWLVSQALNFRDKYDDIGELSEASDEEEQGAAHEA